jgi:hypothetical protein
MRLFATPAVLRKLQAGRGFRVFGRFREDAYGTEGGNPIRLFLSNDLTLLSKQNECEIWQRRGPQQMTF